MFLNSKKLWSQVVLSQELAWRAQNDFIAKHRPNDPKSPLSAFNGAATHTLLQEIELYQWRSSPASSQFVEVEELHGIPPDWVLRVIFNNYSPSLAADGASQPSGASLRN